MKNCIAFSFFLLISISLSAQFRDISVQKSDVPNLHIVEIDFAERSTFIHFSYTNDSSAWVCANDNFYIKDNSTNKKYKLINSINLPICDKVHLLDNIGQVHNFSLEFEKLPDTTRSIDIIETAERGFNMYGVEINKEVKVDQFLNIDDFIAETPVKEYGIYYKDGEPVQYYKHKGIMIAVLLSTSADYGRYYQPNILIQNFTGKDINFDPSLIKSLSGKKGKISQLDVLSYNDYMRKVQNRQAWNAFAVAFSESMAASNAGYSSSTTNSSAYGSSHSYGSASGYYGNTYGSVYGSSSTYSSVYGTSTTNSYNGAAAYAAQQNASNNISNYQNQQFQIKKTLSEGYLRLNTVPDQTEYIGYINISYKNAEGLVVDIPINGTTYRFSWGQ